MTFATTVDKAEAQGLPYVVMTGEEAQDAANGKSVALMGANVSQQYLKAGLVDEMEIHVANVLLMAGRPEGLPGGGRRT